MDAGQTDDKLVCGSEPPTRWDWQVVRGFFAVYGPAKRWINRVRGKRGETGVLSVEEAR